jgi:hypothetical protein
MIDNIGEKIINSNSLICLNCKFRQVGENKNELYDMCGLTLIDIEKNNIKECKFKE